MSRHDLAKGLFPKIPASEAHKYPRIDEDLKRLRDFWEAWEAEQAVIANGGDGDANSVVSNR